MIRKSVFFWGILLWIFFIGAPMPALADDSFNDAPEETIGRTPPRLSYIDGDVSFFRPGAEQWVDAQINTALAPGDQIYVSGSGSMELQIGAEAFVRGGANAQIELAAHEPDFLRFKVVSGQTAFDIRSIASGRALAVVTPDGEVLIDHEGYYRLDVDDQRTTLITRRNGRATVTPAGGDGIPIESNESAVLQDGGGTVPTFQAAPGVDAWDRWNYGRTEQLLATRSTQYVTPGTYGTADLDRYGSWRTSLSYGQVWVPSGVPQGWAPYTTGSWMYDSFYGWTWVDTAPWGWAPYHYGRWVYVNHYWCWAPGPRIRRAVYAPALVAFFGRPGFHVGVSIGGPSVGWVALGWGEPLVPWWGHSHFIHRPWWGGWGGPRYVNGSRIRSGRHITLKDIRHYHNCRVHNALVAVDQRHFGRGRIHHSYLHRVNERDWRPVHQPHNVRPTSASYAPSIHAGKRPPQRRPASAFTRSSEHRVLTTRPSHVDNRDRSRVVPSRNKDESRRPSTIDRPAAVRPGSRSDTSRPATTDARRRSKDDRNRVQPPDRSRPSANPPNPKRREETEALEKRRQPKPYSRLNSPEQTPNRPSRVTPTAPKQTFRRPSQVVPSPPRQAPGPPEESRNSRSVVTSSPRTRSSGVSSKQSAPQPRVSAPSRSNSSRRSSVTITRPPQNEPQQPASAPQRAPSSREPENNRHLRRPEQQPQEDGRGRHVRPGR